MHTNILNAVVFSILILIAFSINRRRDNRYTAKYVYTPRHKSPTVHITFLFLFYDDIHKIQNGIYAFSYLEKRVKQKLSFYQYFTMSVTHTIYCIFYLFSFLRKVTDALGALVYYNILVRSI